MKYEIKSNAFEGPLDLLLHLIKKSDVDIFNIEIETITKQYLEYIEAMEELNLNIASEYLVMAAELIEMKSAILLPKPEIEEDEYEEDLKENLTKRLLEYQKYKDMAPEFRELEEERKQVYTKIGESLKEYQDEKQPSAINAREQDGRYAHCPAACRHGHSHDDLHAGPGPL